MSKKFYKGRYIISFYDKTGEKFLYNFDNVNDILRFIGMEVTKENYSATMKKIYNATQKDPPTTNILGSLMTVYIVDIKDDDEIYNEERYSKMAKYVRIQSTMNITVTPGLQALDCTNEDAHIPDRLKVAARWTKATVKIKKGVDLYPSKIAEWETVKALAKKNVLTIGEYTNEGSKENEEVSKKLEQAINAIESEKKPRRRSRTTLEDAANSEKEIGE